jgi:hypothetical protein
MTKAHYLAAYVGRGGAVEYMKELYMKQLEHPDE